MTKNNKQKKQFIRFAEGLKCADNYGVCTNYIKTTLTDRYIQFAELNVMPKLDITLGNTPLVFGLMNHNDRDVPTLEISHKILRKHPNRTLPMLFHEFTHVCDSYYFRQYDEVKKSSTVLSVYTEIHAYWIQLMCAAGFETISKTRRLMLSDSIISDHKITTIEEFYKNDFIAYKKYIASKPKPLNKSDYAQLRVMAFYYIAKGLFLDEYIDYNCDRNKLYNIRLFSDVLGHELFDIYEMYKTRNHNIDTIIKLHNLSATMGNRYLTANQML